MTREKEDGKQVGKRKKRGKEGGKRGRRMNAKIAGCRAF
jgi:hypothetical protein